MAFPRPRLKLSREYIWPHIDNEVLTKLADQIVSVLGPFGKRKAKSQVRDDQAYSLAKGSFVLGANRVLRELEQGKLCVVVFDRQFLKPPAVRGAIASLAIGKSVHFAAMQTFSSTVAARIGFHSLAAFGIRNNFHTAFEDLVISLKSSIPSVSISQFNQRDNIYRMTASSDSVMCKSKYPYLK